MRLQQVIKERNATKEQIKDGKAIFDEIEEAIKFKDNELSKSGTMGYMSEVGSPHCWWEENCNSYKIISKKYRIDRHFYTVCLIAQAMLDEMK